MSRKIGQTEPATAAATIAQRVGEVRTRRGLSQRELAARAGLRRTAVTEIENGDRGVKVDEWLALAAALNVAPLHLAVPLDGKAEFEVAGETTSAQHIRAWVRGRSPLTPNPSTRDYLDFIAEWPESELQREMEAVVTREALRDSSPVERELLLAIDSDLRQRLEQKAGDLVWEIREGEALRREKEEDDG